MRRAGDAEARGALCLGGVLLACLGACGGTNPTQTSSGIRDAATGVDARMEDVPPSDAMSHEVDAWRVERDAAVEDSTEPRDAGVGVRGEITVQVFRTDAWAFSVNAVFARFAESSCQTRAAGACEVRRCRAESSDEFERRSSAHRGVGEMSISIGDFMQRQTPSEDGLYSGVIGAHDAPRWRPGDPVRFAFAGGSVSAFSISTTFPAMTEWTIAGADAGEEVAIQRARPFNVTWRATGDQGQVRLELSQRDFAAIYPRNHLTIACTFALEAGSGVVPPEVLQELAEDPQAQTTLNVFSRSRAMTMVDGLPVELIAQSLSSVPAQMVVQ